MDYFKQNKAKKLRQQLEAQVISFINFLAPIFVNFSNLIGNQISSSVLPSILTCHVLYLSFQKSNLMFKRLDASALPEDILSNTQPLPMMAHSAGSALWVCAHMQILCTYSMFVLYLC